MEVGKINTKYFELNPVNIVDTLNDIDVPFQKEVKPKIDENVTDLTNSELIARIFQNKTKTELNRKKINSFAKGGGVDESNPKQEVWTPYEFLHTLLPKVYGRDYVVSDIEAKKLYSQIDKEQKELDEYIKSEVEKEGVMNIFQLSVESFERVDLRRKALESKKMFISNSELEAYVLTNPDLVKENYVKKITTSKEDLIERGIIFLDLSDNDVKWIYKYQYLSGNIQAKISDMSQKSVTYKEHLTDDQFKRQMEMLNKTRNPLSRITFDGQNQIFINPNSDFSNKRTYFTVTPDDWKYKDNVMRDLSITGAFKEWLRSDEVSPEEYKYTQGSREVIKYYVDGENPNTGDSRVDTNLKQNSQLDGESLFLKFLNDALTENCKQRLEAIWNAKYNNLVLPKLYKIPVALTLSKLFKNDSEFIPNPTQIQSVQFMRNSGSGLLAYGVGVGKTASSIMNVSYAIDNGLAKKPVFVVPNPTYEKWISEMQGQYVITYQVNYTNENGDENKKIFNEKKDANDFKKEVKGKIVEISRYMKGLLPHLPNIVPLYNLNSDIVRYELKDYTDDEKEELALMDELRDYLSTLGAQTDLTDINITSRIRELYDDFELENIQQSYNIYASDYMPDWQGKTKKKGKVKTLFEFWKTSVQAYIRELPYKLGETKKFPDKTIFVVTYEGLAKMGAESLNADERDTINSNDSLFGTMFTELSQGNEIESIRGRGQSKEADLLENAMFGSVGNPKIFIKDLGIDYAVFDESHNFKKVYTKSKGKPKYEGAIRTDGLMDREKAKYQLGKGGYPSNRALSAFVMVRYIQLMNDNKNICHLTATPFTNEPIEVYSMLALTNYQLLINAGYRWVEDFYDTFMKISFDIRYTVSQQIRKEQVLTGYNNAPQMRQLIFFLMDYKNGDDTNIKRPEKFVMPSYEKGIDTVVPAHPDQENAFGIIKKYIKGEISMSEVCDIVSDDIDVNTLDDKDLVDIIISEGNSKQRDKWEIVDLPLDDKTRKEAENIAFKIVEKNKEDEFEAGEEDEDDKGVVRVLKGLSFIKQVTLSPYLFSCRKQGGNEPTPKQYVETSPKLLYTLNSIKSGHDFERDNNLRVSGSVIYMNIGVSPSVAIKQGDTIIKKKWDEGGFEKIKSYLVNIMGYKESEISIVKGGMSSANKEKEKNKFLAGDSIILIGSSTISTGIDLQNNASSLFVCSFDWNPTDNEQIIGRILRQGNRFSKIRIVFPMIENSADPVIFQLLQEKTLRIKEIWDKDGRSSALDLRDFNPNEFKKKLITDPLDKTQYWYEENIKELEDEMITLQNRQKALRNAGDDYDTLQQYREPIRAMLTVIDAYRKNLKKEDSIKEHKSKVDEITTTMMSEPEKMVKELTKLNKNQYDSVKDPDGRYIPIDLSNADDDELFKHITNWVTNSNSWWDKNSSYDEVDMLNNFVSTNYPNYYSGKWKTDEEISEIENKISQLSTKLFNIGQERVSIDRELDLIKQKYDWDEELYTKDDDFISLNSKLESIKSEEEILSDERNTLNKELRLSSGGAKIQFNSNSWGSGINNKANDWKNAKKLFDKHKERLAIMGIEASNINQGKQMLADRIKELSNEIEAVGLKKDEMFEFFKKEANENKSIAPTVSERVEEFKILNYDFLNEDEILPTFEDDREPVATKPIIEDKVIDVIETEPQFLTDKIEAFKMMLEMEENADEIQFLKDKIEAFEMMLEMEEV